MCLDTVLVDEDEKDLRGEEKECEAVEKSTEKRKQTKESGKNR